MKKLILYFFIFAIAIPQLKSQVTQQWVELYQGPYGKAMVVDGSGDVYVTGWGWGLGYNTIKYNSSGAQQWVKQYHGIDNGNDFAFSIAADNSGNVYVTGWSQGGGNATDIVTVKYDPSGDSVWVQRYRGPGVSSAVPGFEPYVKLIAVDNSGNVYVTGTSYGGSTTGYDYATIKYSSTGVQQWVQRYNNSGANGLDYATSIGLDDSGNVVVSGFSDADAAGTIEDFCTIKYSPSGVQQWLARYNTGGHERVNGMVVEHLTGNVYATGWNGPSNINGAGGYITVKYDRNGNQKWFQTYTGSTYDEASCVTLDASYNVYVSGGLVTGSTASDYLTIKYDSSGTQKWTEVYNNSPTNGYDKANGITVDKAGYIYVTGTSNNGGSIFDYATLKYDNAGNLLWTQRYNDGGNDCSPLALVVDTSYNVYVSGASGTKYMTLKYSQLVGIRGISGNVPKSFSLSQNYPNPFNPGTTIRFTIPVGDAYMRPDYLKIYDILGREVATLVNQQMQPGSYEVNWDASNFPSGVYFYKLTAGAFVEAKKMMLIK